MVCVQHCYLLQSVPSFIHSLSPSQDIQQRLDEANHLLSQMAPWRRRWQEERKTIQERSESSPVHALLSAASVCYLGRTPGHLHQYLQKNWVGYCSSLVELGNLKTSSSSHGYHSQKPILTVQKDFSVQELFSSQFERSGWQQQATFPCTSTLERSLGVRACLEYSSSHWPLVFDPLRLFQGYIKAIQPNENSEPTSLSRDPAQEGSELVVLRVSDANWLEELCNGVKSGSTTMLVLDQQPKQHGRMFLQKLLQRNLHVLTDPALLDTLELEVMSPHFRLVLVLEEQVRDLPSTVLQSLDLQPSEFCVMDMELSTAALETHLLWHTMSLERPEFSVRHRSLLADLTLHEKQVKSSQVGWGRGREGKGGEGGEGGWGGEGRGLLYNYTAATLG